MNAINLALVCTVIYALFVLEPVGAASELGRGQSMQQEISIEEAETLCLANGYGVAETTQDSCQLRCRDHLWTEMAAIDQKKSLSCMRGRNSVGVCLNGRCHSADKSNQQARLSDYRKLKIRAVDLRINLEGCGPVQRLRLNIIYMKPNADRVGSYYNGEAMCTSDFEKVRRLDPTYQYVKFFTCKTLLVHKDARIKFVAEDNASIKERLTFEGEDKLSELRSGSMNLKCDASPLNNPFKYEIEVLPSSG